MPRCGRPARRAVSRPVCADEKNLALSVDRKLRGVSTVGPHTAQPAPAVAPHDPPRQADACRSAIGRPILWENSGFSVDASVRITLLDRDVPSYFQSLEHLLGYCARPPFALERLSVIRDADSRIARIRYVMPRHKAANWVGRGRGWKSTRGGMS